MIQPFAFRILTTCRPRKEEGFSWRMEKQGRALDRSNKRWKSALMQSGSLRDAHMAATWTIGCERRQKSRRHRRRNRGRTPRCLPPPQRPAKPKRAGRKRSLGRNNVACANGRSVRHRSVVGVVGWLLTAQCSLIGNCFEACRPVVSARAPTRRPAVTALQMDPQPRAFGAGFRALIGDGASV